MDVFENFGGGIYSARNWEDELVLKLDSAVFSLTVCLDAMLTLYLISSHQNHGKNIDNQIVDVKQQLF